MKYWLSLLPHTKAVADGHVELSNVPAVPPSVEFQPAQPRPSLNGTPVELTSLKAFK